MQYVANSKTTYYYKGGKTPKVKRIYLMSFMVIVRIFDKKNHNSELRLLFIGIIMLRISLS